MGRHGNAQAVNEIQCDAWQYTQKTDPGCFLLLALLKKTKEPVLAMNSMAMTTSAWCRVMRVVFFLSMIPGDTARAPEEGYSREQLLPLTKFRQQHRRTIDGRLCAAAFVQNRKSYTGCTDAPSPSGESGRAWCYVEAQVLCVYTSNNACPVERNTYSSCWIQVAAKQRGIIVVSMLCALGCACCLDFCDVRSSRIDTCTCAFTLQRGI